MSFSIPYSGSCVNITLQHGLFLFELWGAQGGVETPGSKSGRGAYTVGRLNIFNSQSFLVCVGGQGQFGTANSIEPGFNGGGSVTEGNGSDKLCGTGGGMTSISSMSGELLLVAGAGGGETHYIDTSSDIDIYHNGGYGGPQGGDGSDTNRGGKGATSSEGGEGGYYNTAQFGSISGDPGTKGKGGTSRTVAIGCGGGGGSGYYGGGGAADIGAGGGGSSFSSTIFSHVQLLSGAETFLDPNGQIETGHVGNGYAKITHISQCTKKHPCFKHLTVVYILIFNLST